MSLRGPFAPIDTNAGSRGASQEQESDHEGEDVTDGQENALVRGLAAELLQLDSRKGKGKR